MGWFDHLPTYFLALTITVCGSSPLTAQTGTGEPAIDSTALGPGPHAHMRMKLEKTIFQVDVLMLDVWLGPQDTGRLNALTAGRRYSRELSDSIAQVALNSKDAVIRIEFLRDVSLDQFLDGIDDNLRHVPKAGLISESEYRSISEGLPRWFAFLEEGGIGKGDQILYRISGDTLRTQFRTASGSVLLDQTDVGSESRLAVLGSYFVRKSEFREGLTRSLVGR